MSAPTPEAVAREIAMSAAPRREAWRSALEREILAALRAARAAAIEEAVPPGYVVVPKEPTEAMLHAACKALSPGRRPPEWLTVKEKHAFRYKVMIEAAPHGGCPK